MKLERELERHGSAAPAGGQLRVVLGLGVLCAIIGGGAWLVWHRQQPAEVASSAEDVSQTTSPPLTSPAPASAPSAAKGNRALPGQTRPALPGEAPAAVGSPAANPSRSTRGSRANSAAPSPAITLESVTREFRGAQALFDQGDYAAAAASFGRVVDMIEHEPNLSPDLYRVAVEFAAVSRARAARDAALVFTAADADVVPPTIRLPSSLPARPPSGTPTNRLDVLELVINAEGKVEKARLETARNHYDNRWWVSVAKAWRFQPATKDGRPVRFIARISIADGPP